jgi:putative spermidine/putrescine transport system ATP-binding protein
MDRPAPPQAELAGLVLSGLSLRAGGRTQLDDVSLDIPRGGFCALLGPAACGKSALLDVLAGTQAASAGAASLRGANLLRDKPHRRGLGVVQQNDALFPHLTLAENIAYPLRLRGIGARERRSLAGAALELVQLGHARRLPHQASAAERQRAAWARASIFGPRLLLLDEPLSDQDPAERPAMLAILRRLHIMLGGVTLMATRVAADALALADQVAVLDRGCIAQVAAPARLYDEPVSASVALAGGEANLLPGTVQDIDEDGMARIALACGPLVEATASAGLIKRARCLFFLRPERIAVAAMRAGDMGEGALEAKVLEALNLGDTVRVRLLLGSGAELLVKRPVAAGMRGLQQGQTVAVAWQPEHAAAFPVR